MFTESSKRERKHKERDHKDREHHHKDKDREHRDKEHKKPSSPRRHATESVTVTQREHEHVINVTNKDDDYSEVTVSNYYVPNGNITAPVLDGFIVKNTDLSSPRNGTIPIPHMKRVDSDSDVYSSQVNSPLVSSGTKVTLRVNGVGVLTTLSVPSKFSESPRDALVSVIGCHRE